MTPPEISAAIASVTLAGKLLKGVFQVTQDVKISQEIIEVQGIIADLHSKINDVNSKYSELLESKNEVLAKLKEYQKWDTTAANYELKKLETGSFVQALKTSVQTGETPHYVCPKCFEERKKSVLQGIDEESLLYRCPKCGFETMPIMDTVIVQPSVHFPGLPHGADETHLFEPLGELVQGTVGM